MPRIVIANQVPGSGCWLVTTASGTRYTIDHDNELVTRQSAEGTAMRIDGQTVPLLACSLAIIGLPVLMVVDRGKDDGVVTLVTTTAVVTVERTSSPRQARNTL